MRAFLSEVRCVWTLLSTELGIVFQKKIVVLKGLKTRVCRKKKCEAYKSGMRRAECVCVFNAFQFDGKTFMNPEE